MSKSIRLLKKYFSYLVNFGISGDIPYLQARKNKLVNVIIFSATFILILFLILNGTLDHWEHFKWDILLLIIVTGFGIILQKLKFYELNAIYISSTFFAYTFLVCFFNYDFERQTEHILIPMAIFPLFLFDGWKKNIIFSMYVLSFFVIRYKAMILEQGFFELTLLHLIYLICFAIVYVLVSYFKYDMVKFYTTLEQSNKTKDKLLRIISHDLRSPFNSLLGTSDLQLKYLEEGNSEKFEASSKIINISARKIYDLTQSLLEWSLMQSENIIVNKTKNSLNQMVADVVNFSNIIARSKDIEVIYSTEKDSYILCDYIMTQIAMRNLINNSIKFTERGGKIKVKTLISESNAYIHIEDNGVGMSEEQVKDFENNCIIKTTVGTEKEKGTGLGLMIAKEMIEKQGGELKISSKKYIGTTFTISLPLK